MTCDFKIFKAVTKHLGVRFVYEKETTPSDVALKFYGATLTGLSL